MWNGLNASDRSWPGQSQLLSVAHRLASSSRLPHAWLVVGMAGLPAGPYANLLGHLFVYEAPRETGPCGTCRSCRWLYAGSHPDWIPVRPDGLGIRVDAVREALARVQFRSETGGRQVVRLEQADHLGPEAAAALLKGIEEPHEGTFFVLSADVPGRVPDTVRSRCVVVTLRPLTEAESVTWLVGQGLDPAVTAQVARDADGTATRLRALSQGDPDVSDGGEESRRSRSDDEERDLPVSAQSGNVERMLGEYRARLRFALRAGRISGGRAREILNELEEAEKALWRGIPERPLLDALAVVSVPGE